MSLFGVGAHVCDVKGKLKGKSALGGGKESSYQGRKSLADSPPAVFQEVALEVVVRGHTAPKHEKGGIEEEAEPQQMDLQAQKSKRRA